MLRRNIEGGIRNPYMDLQDGVESNLWGLQDC